MSENSKIEWTDHTFNPWIGCTKVGPGCDHCYAENLMDKRMGVAMWGPGNQRVRTKAANWRKPLAWNAAHDAYFAQYGRRQRVFCASLADVFDNAVDRAWRDDLATLILDTPNLDWLLLTKRIGNAAGMLGEMFLDGPPENIWIGATITSQAEADRDIPKLLTVPAAKRFLSMEPLLGPVDLEQACDIAEKAVCAGSWNEMQDPQRCALALRYGSVRLLDWIIVGGESGPSARPMHPDWALSLRDQCQEAGVPFLFKQWGEWAPGESVERHHGTVATAKWFNEEWSFHEEDLASTDGHFDDEPDLYRIGKKAAGRLLDGRTWDEVPA